MNLRRLTIYAASLCVFLTGAFVLFPEPTSTEECDRVYSSGICSEYYNQLKSHLHSSPLHNAGLLSDEIRRLIEMIERFPDAPDLQREAHGAFIAHLRHTLSVKQMPQHDENNSNASVDRIVRWVYTGANLQDAYRSFLSGYTVETEEGSYPSLLSLQQALYQDPRFKGIDDKTSHEDGILSGNLPTVYGTLSNTSKTTVIRCSKPLIGSTRYFSFAPKISPEFFRFVQLQASHLYINVMKRKGMEGRRSKVIENLETAVPSFYAVTLDKDSSFYKQDENDFPPRMPSLQFKEYFFNQMIKENGNFYWPTKLTKHEWRDELKEILDRVHSHFFAERRDLSLPERRDFIELTYLLIIDRLVERWRPASMNITCNQGMDRGPSLMVLWLHHQGMLDDKDVAALLLTPPLLIHNRPSHRSRIERYVSAACRLRL